MLLRDRLLARMADMGPEPDYQRLAADVLGIRNAPADLARRLVSQALVLEDRREAWRRAGQRVCAAAPAAPGVYVLRDEAGRPLYVGKAINLRRRLRAHFAEGRWRGIKAALARAASADWEETGSELQALIREAELIRALDPLVNVQIGPPDASTRCIPAGLIRDVIVVLPSSDPDAVEFVAARADGGCSIRRACRSGADLDVHAARLRRFFTGPADSQMPAADLAPIVFSWLATRGARQTRLDPHDVGSTGELRARLAALLADERLFAERIVVLDSKFRSASKRP